MTRILDHTIWAPDAIPVGEWKYRNIKRVFLPSFDTFMFFAGFTALFFGISTLDFFWPPVVVRTYEVVLLLSAALAFFGNAYPKEWRSELIGSAGLLGVSIVYLTALLYRTVTVDTTRVFGIFYVLITLAVVLIRLNFISDDWQERRIRNGRS